MTEERVCGDCGKESRTLIYWKGKDRCSKCDEKFEDGIYFKDLKRKRDEQKDKIEEWKRK